MRIRPQGNQHVVRPFQPSLTTDETERHGDAIDHIAHSLAAIDHNLEKLLGAMTGIAALIAQKR
jgi:hypothetical protein